MSRETNLLVSFVLSVVLFITVTLATAYQANESQIKVSKDREAKAVMPLSKEYFHANKNTRTRPPFFQEYKVIEVLPGMRKEQIGELLAYEFGWEGEELRRWNEEYTQTEPEFTEGVYFPDTYYIPANASGQEIADLMIAHFYEKISPYADEFIEKNINWTEAVIMASLIQREAAGPHDMPTIAGVMWNRLEIGMRLQIDATSQYIKGNAETGWWTYVYPADLALESPYNTYLIDGLPPHPIANPSLEAILAVLRPEKTDYFFYIHDQFAQIHGARTYEEHLYNIQMHL